MPRVSLFRMSGYLVSCAVCAAMPSRARADSPPADRFTLSGSVRVRYEVLDGQPRVTLRAEDEQVAIRSTLLGEYRGNGWRIGAEIYDSRAYLDKAGSAIGPNEVNLLELVQAYVGLDLGDHLGPGHVADVQVGRMMLNLGSRRLVAADDYRNTTNGYTGFRASLRTRAGMTATAIYTLPQVRLPDDVPAINRGKVQWDRESFDLRLWGGVVARPRTLAGATVEASYFRLQEKDGPGRPTRNRNLHTISGRIIRDPAPGTWDFEGEGIVQFGTTRASVAPAALRLPVRAWFLHADAGYSFAGPARLRLSVEYDYASGDGPGGGMGRFDTLFGMRRADLAPAGIYNAIGRANISTPGLRAEIVPAKGFDAFAVYRILWLADATDAFSTTGVRDLSGSSGSFAGQQIESRMRYWVVPGRVRAEVNAVWLAKGRFLKVAPNAPATGDTHYLATGLTASF